MTRAPGRRAVKGETASKCSVLGMKEARAHDRPHCWQGGTDHSGAAAIAGIAFAALLGTSIVLLRLSLPDSPAATSAELTPDRRTAVTVALALMPYAGIAFLWFIGVVRDRIGDFEDRFLRPSSWAVG